MQNQSNFYHSFWLYWRVLQPIKENIMLDKSRVLDGDDLQWQKVGFSQALLPSQKPSIPRRAQWRIWRRRLVLPFYSNLEESKLEEVDFDINTIEKTAKIVKFENHPYTIYQIQRQIAEDDCTGKESQVIFKIILQEKVMVIGEIFPSQW